MFAIDRGHNGICSVRRNARCFAGFLINKFRGDVTLFDDGVPTLEALTVVAMLWRVSRTRSISISTPRTAWRCETRPTNAGASGRANRHRPAAPSLERDGLPAADVGRLGQRAQHRSRFDFVILPGSKNTIADLEWLRAQPAWRIGSSARHRSGATVIGICGGYQMLGETIDDPDRRRVLGRCTPTAFSLIPAADVLTSRKDRRRPLLRDSRAAMDVRRLRDSPGRDDARPIRAHRTVCQRCRTAAGGWHLGESRDWHLPPRRVRKS